MKTNKIDVDASNSLPPIPTSSCRFTSRHEPMEGIPEVDEPRVVNFQKKPLLAPRPPTPMATRRPRSPRPPISLVPQPPTSLAPRPPMASRIGPLKAKPDLNNVASSYGLCPRPPIADSERMVSSSALLRKCQEGLGDISAMRLPSKPVLPRPPLRPKTPVAPPGSPENNHHLLLPPLPSSSGANDAGEGAKAGNIRRRRYSKKSYI